MDINDIDKSVMLCKTMLRGSTRVRPIVNGLSTLATLSSLPPPCASRYWPFKF